MRQLKECEKSWYNMHASSHLFIDNKSSNLRGTNKKIEYAE